MRFNSDEKFKIMQITDIQEIPEGVARHVKAY